MSEAPEPSERGRYAIYEQPDGGLVIPRSAPLCERCAGCGCGEQLDPLRIPGMLVKAAMSAGSGGLGERMRMLKGMMKL